VTDMTNMLDASNLCTGNYDATLTGWSYQDVNTLNLGAESLTYSKSASSARQTLIAKGWTITDNGEDTDGNNTCDNDSILGVNDILNNISAIITLSPNPVKDILNVEINSTIDTYFSIHTISGQVISKGKLTDNKIETSSLNNGSFIVTLFNDSMTKSFYFIKE